MMLYFEVELPQNAEAYRCVPLYDDSQRLVGGAIVRPGGSMGCLIHDTPYSRFLQSEGLYFAPTIKDGVLTKGTLYEAKVIGAECFRVSPERIVNDE